MKLNKQKKSAGSYFPQSAQCLFSWKQISGYSGNEGEGRQRDVNRRSRLQKMASRKFLHAPHVQHSPEPGRVTTMPLCACVGLCARQCACEEKKIKLSTIRAVRHSTSEGELPSVRRSHAVWLSWDSAGRGQRIACVCLVGL